MAIPSELSSYANEDDFCQRYIIPLLGRLGFSIVVNYHGAREFGKDVVFGEIDRFGHVVYHGMQVKHVESVSLTASEDLVLDAKQAFANPFKHPQKGNEERVSTFYAVNAGSIAEQAQTHFFNSLSNPFGGNVRLIDGKGLLNLDRQAVASRVDSLIDRLRGLSYEIANNINALSKLVKKMEDCIEGTGGFPVIRLRNVAMTAYLQCPFLPDDLPIETLNAYWQEVEALNSLADFCGLPLMSREVVKERRLPVLADLAKRITEKMNVINAAILSVYGKLQPLAPI